MTDQPEPTIPPDDPMRQMTVARPDRDEHLPHLGLVGDTYTILVTGEDTAGKYTLIDMHVPPAGGPPAHRHDFEEMFSVLEGEVQVTFRGETLTARAGETINVPANAPHAFTNASDTPRGCCACAPLPGRTSSSPSSVSRWRPAPRTHPRWTRPSRLRSSPGPRSWPRASAPTCCHRTPTEPELVWGRSTRPTGSRSVGSGSDSRTSN